jgi:hypothetical protein
VERQVTTVALGALVVALVVVVVARGRREPAPAPPERPTPTVPSLVALPVPAPCIQLPSAMLPPLALPAPSSSRPLPPGAPKAVRFGVVMFQYRGAQLAPDAARSRDEALALAKTAVDTGRRDFKAAVKTGDAGSTEDAGRMSRGILEPTVELELFTLAPGAVSEPIDTPRGFWVAKRIE